MDLKEERLLGEAIHQHWYYTSKVEMVTRHLDKSIVEILDVGAGAGWFSRWLLEHGFASAATCVDPGYPDAVREETVNGAPLRYLRSVNESAADLILMMDVLEHVDDDAGLLANYWAMARPGTRFLITVPAFQSLWSAHDDFLEHRRRYTLATLRDTVQRAGAEPLRQHYYFGLILPIAVVVRALRRSRPANRSDMAPQPQGINAILRGVCAAERIFMRLNRIAGLSAVMVLEKPDA